MASAAAMKQAPARQNAPKKTNGQQPKTQAKRPAVSRPVGIAVMAVLLCASLFVGNMRALGKATPKDFLRQGDVSALVEERVKSARNAETVAKRAGLDSAVYQAVEDAAKAVETARSARALSRADQALASAVGDMAGSAAGSLTGQDPQLLTGAMDTFNDAENMLRFEARSFNEKAEKALSLYERLPLRALLAQPDYFEGL